MASIAETAAARIASILTVAGIAAGRVYRDRTEAFAQAESPAVVVEIDAEERGHYGGSQQRGAMFDLERSKVTFMLTYCTRSDDWQTALDGIRLEVHALLLNDDTLNELLQGFKAESTNWQAVTADTPFASITQRYGGTAMLSANQL